MFIGHFGIGLAQWLLVAWGYWIESRVGRK